MIKKNLNLVHLDRHDIDCHDHDSSLLATILSDASILFDAYLPIDAYFPTNVWGNNCTIAETFRKLLEINFFPHFLYGN